MTKLLFVQEGERELDGLMAISSYVKKNHDVGLMVSGKENLEKKINSFSPDVIGIPVLTKDHYWTIKISNQIKKINPSIITLLGGVHPTFYRKIIHEEPIDAICLYEGEKPVLELLNRIENNHKWTNISSLWTKGHRKINKNPLSPPLRSKEIPIPDRKLYKDIPGIKDSSELQIMSSRGCPFKCNFCTNYGVREEQPSSFFRVRSPKAVIEEIDNARKDKNIETILFQDDIFGVNRKWFREFSELYLSEVNLPFYSLIRCESVTKDFVEKLKEMGCYEVGIGIESGNERIRNEVLGKNLSTKKIKEAVKILKESNISFHTFSMFGVPEETLDNAFETLNLNLELKPDVAYTQMFHPYPGTKFFNKEVEEKIINPNFDKFKTNFSYSPDFKKIQRLQKLSMLTVKYPFIKSLLPLAVNLPLDNLYDKISKTCWERLYYKQITNKREAKK